ncbi:MAG: SirB1 family protein [Acidobacteriota bacterium]
MLYNPGMTSNARWRFLDIIRRPEQEIDLAEAAFLIALEEYPSLDIAAYMGRLDQLAEGARPGVERAGENPFAVIDALNAYLFGRQRFRGNTREYFDPRNSFLNEVLDRRRGIPITLSVIYLEVASRLGFPLEGVGFPGHFLVRHSDAQRNILVDPFHGGEILLAADCRSRLRATFGESVPLRRQFFEPVGTKRILARMLNNLKHIYMKDGDYARALRAIERLLMLTPDDVHQIRDRGVARFKLVRLGSAASDLEAYIRLVPEASDCAVVRKQLRAIRRLTAMLN